jgi:hypothetical protein
MKLLGRKRRPWSRLARENALVEPVPDGEDLVRKDKAVMLMLPFSEAKGRRFRSSSREDHRSVNCV